VEPDTCGRDIGYQPPHASTQAKGIWDNSFLNHHGILRENAAMVIVKGENPYSTKNSP
jgi:hypothetical protein